MFAPRSFLAYGDAEAGGSVAVDRELEMRSMADGSPFFFGQESFPKEKGGLSKRLAGGLPPTLKSIGATKNRPLPVRRTCGKGLT